MSTINFEKAIKYIKSLSAVPDSNLTPDVIIKWDKTKSYRTEWGSKIIEKSPVFYCPKTGEVKFLDRAPDNYKHDYLFDNREDMRIPYRSNEKISVTTAKKEIFSYYGKYHKEIDAFEIASVVMKGGRSKDGEKRCWEYKDVNLERYFLFRNGEAIKGFSYLQKDGNFYDKTLLHWLTTDIPQNIHNRDFDKQALVFFGFKVTEEWLNQEVYWLPFRMGRWYKNVAERPVKENSVKKSLMESEELTSFSEEYLTNLFKNMSSGVICVPYKDGVVVRYYIGGAPYREKYRFFFNEKEEFILKESENKWKTCAANNCYQSCTTKAILNFNELRKIKRIDRCVDVLLDNEFLNKESFLINLIYTLKYPIVEKLGKAGYKYLMSKMICSPMTVLRDKFGTTPKKTGTLCENLGVNKIQLKILEQFRDPYKNTLPTIKFVKQIGGDDIIHWDEKKSRKIFKFAYQAGTWVELVLKENHLGAPEYLRWSKVKEFVPTEQDKKSIKNLINIQYKNPDVDTVALFRDTVLTMCDRVHEVLPNMNPFEAKTLRDLQWMHDQYTNIANAKKYNNLKKDGQWDKFNQKRIEKYEKIGDEFEIIVPREPGDIINEGANLSHCVGSYLGGVASGQKTILFLRKVSEPEKSFYTIEIGNSNVIQIHGKHNKWLGNNPEAIQFVIDWLQDIQIYCPLRILFNLGQGYSGSYDNLDHSNYKLNKFVTV